MKTLILIDPQIDFMPGGNLPVADGDQIIPVINQIQLDFDLVVATQDWHPQDHISFAVNHPGKKVFDVIEIEGQPQTLWPAHCVQGSIGAGFKTELDTRPWETIFRKGTRKEIDSYSGFYDNGHLRSTGLASYLKDKTAGKLYFCGLAADICVYFSIKDALSEGFHCSLIEDAAKPLDTLRYAQQKEELTQRGVTYLNSTEL